MVISLPDRVKRESRTGAGDMGWFSIIMITLYIVLIFMLTIYTVVAFWSSAQPAEAVEVEETVAEEEEQPTTTEEEVEGEVIMEEEEEEEAKKVAAETGKEVTYFGWTFTVSRDVGLLLLVVLVGAIGSLVHAGRSIYWHAARRELRRSRWPKYILLPFIGPVMALVLYFVIRGGLFAGTEISEANIYGFLAVAGLSGMFSEQAAEKLKSLAEDIFKKPEKIES